MPREDHVNRFLAAYESAAKAAAANDCFDAKAAGAGRFFDICAPATTPGAAPIAASLVTLGREWDALQPGERRKLEPRLRSVLEEAASGGLAASAGSRKAVFRPEKMDKTIISIPLLDLIKADEDAYRPVIIDLNLGFPGPPGTARERVGKLIEEVSGEGGSKDRMVQVRVDATVLELRPGLNRLKSDMTEHYLFAVLTGRQVRTLVERNPVTRTKPASKDQRPREHRAIYKIWPDFLLTRRICVSTSTVKADAAAKAFCALGADIVWAIMDSGIDRNHPHFAKYGNLNIETLGLEHVDFTDGGSATGDPYGHGTHVAGIVAGWRDKGWSAATRVRDGKGEVRAGTVALDSPISGMAPLCKLLSLRVLDANGQGLASNVIAAIAYLQKVNNYGKLIRVHGVNLSAGYDFDPEWFACGQSPLCVEIDRLVKSGVVVVVAAGNTGYGFASTAYRGTVASGLPLTINDPGNADLAITVGSTHRDMPHIYGVSFFSSKGPTGDGRLKPDLVAPGEKIISCATGSLKDAARQELKRDGGKRGRADFEYREDSGTSMAAPHVSGVIAGFLSVRREFIGRPEKVKEIFMSTATDLGRERYFQGRGLVDLMRAIQSV